MDVIIHTQVYNGEKTLRRTIESVLRQTYDNFIYYISDNASTDSTRDIIEEYAQRDKRVVAKYNNSNEFYAYLDVITECCEKHPNGYWAMLDADDEYLPEFLEKALETALENDLDIVVCGYEALEEETGERIYLRQLEQDVTMYSVEFFNHIAQYNLFMRTVWGKLYSLSLLSKCNFNQVETMPSYGGDTVLVMEAFTNAGKVCIMAKTLLIYYISTSSVTYRWEPKRIDSDHMLDDIIKSYIIKNCGGISVQQEHFLINSYGIACVNTLTVLLEVKIEFADVISNLIIILDNEKTIELYANSHAREDILKGIKNRILSWLMSREECNTPEGAVLAAEVVDKLEKLW